MKYLPGPTWQTRCLRFDNDAYANPRHHVRVTNEGKGNKIKGFKSFDKCFYSLEQAKCWGIRLTIKLLINIQKSVWLEACSCALAGASSWVLVRHLLFFLRESRKAAAWWEHWLRIVYFDSTRARLDRPRSRGKITAFHLKEEMNIEFTSKKIRWLEMRETSFNFHQKFSFNAAQNEAASEPRLSFVLHPCRQYFVPVKRSLIDVKIF